MVNFQTLIAWEMLVPLEAINSHMVYEEDQSIKLDQMSLLCVCVFVCKTIGSIFAAAALLK